MKRAVIALLGVGCMSHATVTPTDAPSRRALLLDPSNAEWRRAAPPVSHLRFETTKGTFVLELIREWGPIGADRLYNLARLGYYDDTRFHRVNKNYIAQFGLHGDSAVNAAWANQYLPDDPPRSNNVRGTFAFSFKGSIPNTRNTQIYINLADNTRNNAEAFTMLGTVVEGMSVVDSLYSGYGENSGSGVRQGRQGPLANGGNAYVDREYPLLDRIKRVTVTEVKERTSVPSAAVDTAFLQRLLVAEDSRGLGANGVAPLVDGLATTIDPRIRLAAVRGLGRLERAELVPRLAALLDDPSPAIRAEAANAVAESMQNVPGASGPRRTAAPDSLRLVVRPAVDDALTKRIERETDPRVLGAIARSVGRLPYPDSASVHAAERTILRAAERARTIEGSPGRAAYDVINGLYILVRTHRSLGDLTPQSFDLLRQFARVPTQLDARRAALLALAAAGGFDTALVVASSRDADWQIRRLALTGVRVLSATSRDDVIRRALHDSVAMVRTDAMRLVRGTGTPDCAPLVEATRDPSPLVVLAAVDALGGPCADAAARDATLGAIAATLPAGDPARVAGRVSWHAAAHALVALARAGSPNARTLVPRFAAHPRQHVRAYAARAGAILGDDALLTRLAADPNNNVQEAAVIGLQQLRGHAADSVYMAVLASRGYQAVLAAAKALEGATTARAAPALITALDRLSADRRENSRDPRVAIVTRLAELGSPAFAPRLERYLVDFDSSVAAAAASAITRLTGRVATARPNPLPIRDEPLARIFLSSGVSLRVTMATGGRFTIALDVLESPASVARVVRLANAGYYNGLTWHRMVPNFVIQGGSPDENEYVGDASFMRDEIDMRPHHRGTVGISTRGHDTGDAQLFVNLVDNPRLEHSSPLFGTVISGMDVVDDILEGDVIRRIEVVGWK